MGDRLGFAVPSDVVRSVTEQLRKYGSVRRGDIGVEVQSITPLIMRGLGFPRASGVVVAGVKPGSTAEQAGVKPSDILLSINGKSIGSVPDIESALYFQAPSESMHLELLRNHQTLNINVRVTTRPVGSVDALFGPDPDRQLVPRLGIFARDLDKDDPELKRDLRESSGVLVKAKVSDTQPFGCDLRPGDVIHSLNGRPLADLQALRDAIEKLAPGDAAVFLIERNHRSLFVGFEID
jgi:S1-C subfamily serine protease